jgi:metal-responsive CopG/Arc/MetJ family transcriptional regulator
MTSYTLVMKTAISIPDDLFRAVEACSRRLKLSRSRLFASAAREYLARHGTADDPTDAWNQAIAEAGQPGEEPAAIALRRRGKAVIKATMSKRR